MEFGVVENGLLPEAGEPLFTALERGRKIPAPGRDVVK